MYKKFKNVVCKFINKLRSQGQPKKVAFYYIIAIMQDTKKEIQFPWYEKISLMIGSLYYFKNTDTLMRIKGISPLVNI